MMMGLCDDVELFLALRSSCKLQVTSCVVVLELGRMRLAKEQLLGQSNLVND